jgi:D-alanine-D-alanine ligase
VSERICLGILYGSRSPEHEVSIISALQLASMADPFKYDVVLVYISNKGEWFIGGSLWKLETYLDFNPRSSGLTPVFPDLTTRSRALIAFKRGRVFSGERRYAAVRLDCVIPVMHGRTGEDGSLQGMLELMDLPYASTGVAGSAVGMDKIMMKRLFAGNGFPVLPDVALTRSAFEKKKEETCAEVEKALGYPVFVKPANLGSSIGVSRAADRRQLEDALTLAFTLDRRCLVEKGLDDPLEVNCSVLGFDDEVMVSVVEQPVREGSMLDFRTKYLAASGESGMAALSRIIPAPIGPEKTEQVQRLSLEIFKALDCKGVVRVDYMIDRAANTLFITEINTIPGSMAFYLWDKTGEGLRYRQLIDHLVDSAVKAHRENGKNISTFRSDIIVSAIKRGHSGTKAAKG